MSSTLQPGCAGDDDALSPEGNRPPELVGFERYAPRVATQDVVVRILNPVEPVFVGADETQDGRG